MPVLSDEKLEEFLTKTNFEDKLKKLVLETRDAYIEENIEDSTHVVYDGIWNSIMYRAENICAGEQ